MAASRTSGTRLNRILCGLIVFFALLYLIWPYGTLTRLWLALKAEDRSVVERMVDWSSVREGFELDVIRFLRRQASRRISIADGQLSVSLSFENSNIGRPLAERLATPDALILLFNRPQILECIGQNVGLADAEAIAAKCVPKRSPAAAGDPAPAESDLPNVPRIFEKTSYAFFTGLFEFRLNLKHDGVPMDIRLRRQGFGWKVTRIAASFAEVEPDGG